MELIGFEVGAFAPFVPGVDKDQVFTGLGDGFLVLENGIEPLLVKFGGGTGDDGWILFAASGIIPAGGDARKAKIIGGRFAQHVFDDILVFKDATVGIEAADGFGEMEAIGLELDGSVETKLGRGN